jgi:hypothetical protein
MKKIDKIINYFRNLKEEGPTMSSGNGGFSGSSNPKGPTAGFDPILGMRKRKNNEVDLRTIDSKLRRWVKSIRNK